MTRPGRGRARLVLFLLFLFVAINFADKGILGLAAAPITHELGLSAAQFGIIASSFYLLFTISAIGGGFLGNRVASKWLLVTIAVIWAAAQLPVLIPGAGFAALLGTRILLGAGEGPVSVLANHTAFSWFPAKERGLPAAVVAIGPAVGVIVSAPLLQLAITGLGWRSAFGILGVVGLVWAAAWMFVGKSGRHDDAQRISDPPAAAPAAERHQPYRRLLLSGTFLGCVAGGFATYWLLALTSTFLPLYLRQVHGFTPTAISYVVGLPGLATVILMLAAGMVSQRLVKRGTSRRVAQGLISGSGVLLAGAALLVMIVTSGATMAIVMMTMAIAAAAVQIPLGNAALADAVPAAQRSAVLGVWYGAVSVASIAAPYVTGLILDSAPSVADGYLYAFLVAAVLSVVGGGLAAWLIKPDRDAIRLRAIAVSSDSAGTPTNTVTG